jgi:hypothetical protein
VGARCPHPRARRIALARARRSRRGRRGSGAERITHTVGPARAAESAGRHPLRRGRHRVRRSC